MCTGTTNIIVNNTATETIWYSLSIYVHKLDFGVFQVQQEIVCQATNSSWAGWQKARCYIFLAVDKENVLPR